MISALRIVGLGVASTERSLKSGSASRARLAPLRRRQWAALRLGFAIWCGLILPAGRADAQQSGPLPVSPLATFAPSEAAPSTLPKPVMPSDPEVLPGFPQTPDQPASLYAPTVASFTCDAPQGPYFDCDPRTDPPVLPQPGWFADVEVGIMLPHITDDAHDAVTVDGKSTRVQLPGGTIDWTAAPRLEVGYRLPEGFGEIAFAYRFLGSTGSSTISGPFSAPDAPGSVHNRLDINIADLDYASNELSICSWWAKWRLGLRGADNFFDTTVTEPLAAAEAGSGVFERRISNNFWGIGPHGSLELERRLTDWGLMVLGRVDGSILLGRVNQDFYATSTTKVAGQFLTGATYELQGMAVPELEGNIGLGWRPPSYPSVRVFAGYENEHWWNVGHVVNSGSVAEIYSNGVLLRVDINY
jgi:hypothetical protein